VGNRAFGMHTIPSHEPEHPTSVTCGTITKSKERKFTQMKETTGGTIGFDKEFKESTIEEH